MALPTPGAKPPAAFAPIVTESSAKNRQLEFLGQQNIQAAAAAKAKAAGIAAAAALKQRMVEEEKRRLAAQAKAQADAKARADANAKAAAASLATRNTANSVVRTSVTVPKTRTV